MYCFWLDGAKVYIIFEISKKTTNYIHIPLVAKNEKKYLLNDFLFIAY